MKSPEKYFSSPLNQLFAGTGADRISRYSITSRRLIQTKDQNYYKPQA